MHDIKVATGAYIPKDNIALFVAYGSRPIKNDVTQKKQAGLVHDFTFGKRADTAIHLKSGEVVLVNTSPDTINQRMQASVTNGAD